MYECFACTYIRVSHVHRVLGAQKDARRALDPLELEVQVVVSCPEGAGNPSPFSAGAGSALSC